MEKGQKGTGFLPHHLFSNPSASRGMFLFSASRVGESQNSPNSSNSFAVSVKSQFLPCSEAGEQKR